MEQENGGSGSRLYLYTLEPIWSPTYLASSLKTLGSRDW